MAKIFKLFPTALYLEDNVLNTKELKETVKLCKDISKIKQSKQVWVSDTYNTLMTHNIVKDKRFKNVLNKLHITLIYLIKNTCLIMYINLKQDGLLYIKKHKIFKNLIFT